MVKMNLKQNIKCTEFFSFNNWDVMDDKKLDKVYFLFSQSHIGKET